MTLPHLRTALVAAAAALTLAVTVLPAGSASAAPTLSAVFTDAGDPGDPTLLDTLTERGIDLAIGVSEGGVDVTVTPSGDGLVFSQPSLTFSGQPAGTFAAWLRVRASTPGFHTLTVTVTAPGAAPVVLTDDRLWAPGDTHLPATGSLAGQTWGAQVPTDEGSRFVDGTMIWFLDADTAAIGNSRGGRPTCGQAPAWNDEGPCVSYAYDASTGLLELGRAIGIVRPGSIHLAGVGGDLYGGSFELGSRAAFTFRLAALRAGKRLDATFTFVNRLPRPSRRARTLVLRRNGTFTLSDYYGKDRRGTYAIGRHGRLALRTRGLGTKLETFLAVVGPSGTNPRRSGAWMTVYEDEGRTAYTSSSLLTTR